MIVARREGEARKYAGACFCFSQGQGEEQQQCGALTYGLLGLRVS